MLQTKCGAFLMIYKLNQECNAFLVGIGSTGRSKTQAVTLGLARALAYSLELPPGAVEDVYAYYRSEHKIRVSNDISRILEICLLDTDAVLKEVEAFYFYRYFACYGDKLFYSGNVPGEGIHDVFKLHKNFSDTTLAFIKDNAMAIGNMNSGFVKVIEQIRKVD
jgi:hypothetical protein